MTSLSRLLRRRPEDGSIILFLAVSVIAGTLVVALMGEVLFGISLSARSGASANALQVADAGINDAVQQIPYVAGTSFSRTASVGNGTYSYTATEDSTYSYVWHIDSVGTDVTGVKRQVKADATASAEDLLPIYINGTGSLSAGVTLDSFTSGLDTATGCTGQGILGVSDGSNLNFTGSGVGNSNCDSSYSMDKCAVYYSGSSPPPLPAQGTAKCPPSPQTYYVSPAFPLSNPASPPGSPQSSYTCSASNPLTFGSIEYATTVNLANGCYVEPSSSSSGPAVIYLPSSGSLTISGTVNSPTSLSSADQTTYCPGYANWTYSDLNSNPAISYCPDWSGKLIVYTAGASINISGHTLFWGVINAPSSTFNIPASANHLQMWGSLVVGSMNAGAQANFHYDQSLANLTQSSYTLSNWREEPAG
ncbi:MAG TPA: hypothetical protein VNF50_08550 [Acidimicrobiales bacterium]|nr:hypothetical protein [Acidimicrobiales bacterium]